MTDIVIIGAGPAGLTAALYATRAGAKVKIIESGAPGGKLNSTADIENYPGIKKKMGPELAYEMYEHALNFGAELEMTEVTGIKDLGDHKTVLTTNGEIETKNVIIATGTKERLMNIPGEKEYTGKGVSYCAVCDGPFFKGKETAIIGGGNSAIEEAVYLAGFVSKVHIIVRRDVFRADKYIIDKAKSMNNIVFHTLKKPLEVIGDGHKVTGLKLIDSKTNEESLLEVSGIFPFIGLDPMTGFASNLDITDEKGYIEVDEHMQTKIKGIFAVGDVTNKQLRQIVTAANDGAIAGQYIASNL